MTNPRRNPVKKDVENRLRINDPITAITICIIAVHTVAACKATEEYPDRRLCTKVGIAQIMKKRHFKKMLVKSVSRIIEYRFTLQLLFLTFMTSDNKKC